jgi:hypothetical protein
LRSINRVCFAASDQFDCQITSMQVRNRETTRFSQLRFSGSGTIFNGPAIVNPSI